jgi:photosystem II stability/assembly factor-like uncharacterized protein
MRIFSFTRSSSPSGAITIKVSNDDGVSFTNHYVNAGDVSEPNGALVTNDQSVFLIGGATKIYRSSDGGLTFAEVYTPVATSAIHFACFSPTDENKVWMVGRSERVHYSSDNGVTWNLIWQAPGATLSGYIYYIHMASNLIGYMCGYIHSGGVLTNSVWKTTDGGNNWSVLKSNFTYIPYCVFAVDTSTIYLLESNAAGCIWKSTDGGSTWVNKGTGGKTIEGKRLYATESGMVWATGRNLSKIEVAYSSDGGTTWNKVDVADSGASISDTRCPIKFISDSVGYICSLKCWKSIDGGQTWNNQGGIPAGGAAYLSLFFALNPAILTQFRSFNVAGTEPADRTSEGSAVTQVNPLNFGQMPKGNDSNVKCIIWRATNLGAYSTLSNMRFWAYDLSEFVGTNTYHADITDSWTQNKTPAQVKAGTPGTCPQAEPAANLTKIGGGNITGVGHADTSQYIYLVNAIGNDETDGDKDFVYRVKFDYA